MPHYAPASGLLQVTTSTSTYLIDFDHRTATRLPGTCETSQFPVAALRRDHSPITLLSLDQPALGQPWTLLLAGLAHAGPTARTTTPVTSIAWLRRPKGVGGDWCRGANEAN